jgi:hypothetical protein
VRVNQDMNAALGSGPVATSNHEMLALFIYNDEYGSLQMRILQDAGMDIPGDIARMGCEAPPTCEMLRPRLTPLNPGPVSPARDIAIYSDLSSRGRRVMASPIFLRRARLLCGSRASAQEKDHITSQPWCCLQLPPMALNARTFTGDAHEQPG